MLRYAAWLAKREHETMSYRNFTADCLQELGKSVANALGGGWIDKRWCEIVNPHPAVKMTPEEQFYHTIKQMGFTIAGREDDV